MKDMIVTLTLNVSDHPISAAFIVMILLLVLCEVCATVVCVARALASVFHKN